MTTQEITTIANILREKPSHDVEDENQEKRAKFIQDQIGKMNEEQLIRFDFYMRSHFKKNHIKQLISSSLQPLFQDTPIHDEMAIVVGSLAKLYVGELIETATEILKSDKDEPPGLRKHHIMEAYQQMCRTTNFDPSNSPFLFSSHEAAYFDECDLHSDPFLGKLSTNSNESDNFSANESI